MWLDVDRSGVGAATFIPKDFVFEGGLSKRQGITTQRDTVTGDQQFFKLDYSRRIEDIIVLADNASLPGYAREALGYYRDIYLGNVDYEYEKGSETVADLMRDLSLDYSVCKLGTGGVLTNPNADARERFKIFVYDDGLLEFTTAGTADATRTLLDSGRMCANAKYQAVGVIPGYSYRTQFRTVQFKADMAALTLANMCHWLYGLTAVTSVTGWANLSNVTSMRYAMNGCTGVTSLDLRGMDPSSLTDLFYAFAGCSALTTIYADSTWALPNTASGSGTFYNCQNLVGGNDTAYSASAYGYTRMVIDRAGQAGYLTAS